MTGRILSRTDSWSIGILMMYDMLCNRPAGLRCIGISVMQHRTYADAAEIQQCFIHCYTEGVNPLSFFGLVMAPLKCPREYMNSSSLPMDWKARVCQVKQHEYRKLPQVSISKFCSCTISSPANRSSLPSEESDLRQKCLSGSIFS